MLSVVSVLSALLLKVGAACCCCAIHNGLKNCRPYTAVLSLLFITGSAVPLKRCFFFQSHPNTISHRAVPRQHSATHGVQDGRPRNRRAPAGGKKCAHLVASTVARSGTVHAVRYEAQSSTCQTCQAALQRVVCQPLNRLNSQLTLVVIVFVKNKTVHAALPRIALLGAIFLIHVFIFAHYVQCTPDTKYSALAGHVVIQVPVRGDSLSSPTTMYCLGWSSCSGLWRSVFRLYIFACVRLCCQTASLVFPVSVVHPR